MIPHVRLTWGKFAGAALMLGALYEFASHDLIPKQYVLYMLFWIGGVFVPSLSNRSSRKVTKLATQDELAKRVTIPENPDSLSSLPAGEPRR